MALEDFTCRDTANGELAFDPMIKGMTAEYGSCQLYRDSIFERASVDDDLGSIWIDDSVGALLTALEDKGILENTIFLFQQDHGMEAKSALYENGVRIAQFVHYPNVFGTSGIQLVAPVSTIDVGPTVFDLAGIPAPYSMDGRSWKALIDNPIEEMKWLHERCLFFEMERDRAVRCGCDKFLSIDPAARDQSSTVTRGNRKGLSIDDENLFDLCGGTDEYITDSSMNMEADGLNLLSSQPEAVSLCFFQRHLFL